LLHLICVLLWSKLQSCTVSLVLTSKQGNRVLLHQLRELWDELLNAFPSAHLEHYVLPEPFGLRGPSPMNNRKDMQFLLRLFQSAYLYAEFK